ncbi:hypothetical protein C095_02825 [Fusobacterium necrophorum subsp. funduliforme B35]|uniref:Uncharacterized protein n=1 Tax=Fusobacterium necrophorum subsp. funduliforme B35 TaxID=1226633 RepID=A0A0B4EXR4_9FUSO|nr:hypothetical protein C095_02825 [Fusobacterium necrophorum subsp. funduliforme B35]
MRNGTFQRIKERSSNPDRKSSYLTGNRSSYGVSFFDELREYFF